MKSKKIIAFIMILVLSFILVSCNKEGLKEVEVDSNQVEAPKKGDLVANIKTSHGDIKVKLFEDAAPKAVENFTTHAENGYYDGITFHRVIDDFMIQTGDPEGTGRGGESIWGEAFEDEFHPNYHNIRGALSMANSGPNTNGSQFFIVQANTVDENFLNKMEKAGEDAGYSEEVVENYRNLGGTPWLDFVHTVFGQVYEGMDVVDSIAKEEVTSDYKPVEKIIIESIEIGNYK